MSVPDTIAVEYSEDYYTDRIGRCADGGQFMAFVVATLPLPPPKDWKAHKRWYAVLHTFDATGRHRDTKAWFAGTTADGEKEVCERAAAKRDEMVAALGDVELCDVRVKLFSVEIDGHVFGMIDTSDPERGPTVTLQPNDFLFYPPWDGAFDT